MAVATGRVDGRIGYAPHGLNVGGEPCVWCGGQCGSQRNNNQLLDVSANRKSHGDCNNNQGHVHHTAMRFVSPTTGW